MSENRILLTGGSGFIGTHLVEKLIALNTIFLNLDHKPPLLKSHRKHWVCGDIMRKESVESIFSDFKPTHVFHLAAKANLNGQSIEDFPINVKGTENVLKCTNSFKSIERFIHFSTQYVVRPGVWPKSDTFLLPYTPYGESKAVAEILVRGRCKKSWTILRPTNVWGPYHPTFPKELWKYLKLRLYMHPGKSPIKKYYAYVTNAVDQIIQLTLDNADRSAGKTYYISDPPIDNASWMDAFSVALTGKRTRRIPIPLWYCFAKLGDAINQIGLKFPMSTDRLFRLTVNEQLPFEASILVASSPKVSLQEGVNRSVKWYQKVINNAENRLAH